MARAGEAVLQWMLADRDRDLTPAAIRRARTWAIVASSLHGILLGLSTGLLLWSVTYPWPSALGAEMASAAGVIGGGVAAVGCLVAGRQARGRSPSLVTGRVLVCIATLGIPLATLHLSVVLGA